MARSTFHNHTTFCDGRNTVEEMVLAAIELGMPSIGFSGHGYTWFDESYCMSLAATEDYKREIARQKMLHGDKIRILCGIEQDYFSTESTLDYDFVIGSVHYILHEGRYLDVDNTFEEQYHDVQTYYNGDYYAYCADFFAEAATVLERTGCTVVGHFDLVTKFNENDNLFNTSDSRYLEPALRAVRKLCDEGAIFEINTGAMAKGYRTTPYPSTALLDEIAAHRNKVILSSDCHSTNLMQFGIEDAAALATAHGLQILEEL